MAGQPGSGLGAMLQTLCHKWSVLIYSKEMPLACILKQILFRGLHEKLWHDRFDFVFRVRLGLLLVPGFWDGCEHDPICAEAAGVKATKEVKLHRLAWLVLKSLEELFSSIDASNGHPDVNLDTITLCLTTFPGHMLLLLDHFDEVGSASPCVQCLCE